jgi:hypothetical protein
VPRVKRPHNAINVKKQRAPLVNTGVPPLYLPLSKVESDLGLFLNEARRLLPPSLKTWEAIKRSKKFVSEAKMFAGRRKSVDHRGTLSGDLLDRHGVRNIVWGTSEVNAHTDKDHPHRAEILNLYQDTTHLAEDIISNDDEIVGPLELQRSATLLKSVDEPEANDEGVSAQRRERL